MPTPRHPLSKLLNLSFKDSSLLAQAFTHSSYANLHHLSDNERLEFLGDAILSSIAAEWLYKENPTLPEGGLTKLRAQAVQGNSLAAAAKRLGLEPHLRHSLNKPNAQATSNLLEQAFEALIGAMFLEMGYEKTKTKVVEWLFNERDAAPSGMSAVLTHFNPKGKLQELLQPKVSVEEIEYRLKETTGPDHDRKFTVELYVAGKLISTGVAGSKKTAEEKAAGKGFKKLKNEIARISDS